MNDKSVSFKLNTSKKSYLFIKRFFDLITALLLFPIIFMVICFFSVILIFQGRPVLYKQKRMGYNGKEFSLYKLRTMRNGSRSTDEPWTIDNDSRITPIGKLIRKFYIDELPQLYNIIKGDMSFIGPRPESVHIAKELENIIPNYREKYSIKPGLSGWAQIKQGYTSSIEEFKEKMVYDKYYIDNFGFFLDIKIFALTFFKVFRGTGR